MPTKRPLPFGIHSTRFLPNVSGALLKLDLRLHLYSHQHQHEFCMFRGVAQHQPDFPTDLVIAS